MDQWLFIWLGVIVVTIVVEIITVGLTSIWLTGGALAALIVCALGGHWGLQMAVFFIITFLLLYFTRPWAIKHINNRKIKTNYEEAIGKEVRVTETVDNRKGTGKAVYNGMEWTVRSAEDEVIFKPEELAIVKSVQGVKLILVKQ